MKYLTNNPSLNNLALPLQELSKYGTINSRTIFIATATIFMTKYLIDVYKRLFISPLRKIPGPLYFQFFPWLLRFDVIRDKLPYRLHKLHKKYGDVVRLNEYNVSLCSPEMIKELLVTQDLPKGKAYESLREHPNLPNLFNMTDKNVHKQRRRTLSPAFALSYISSIEPLINASALSVVERLQHDCQQDGGETIIDMWGLLARMALDAIGDTAFGGSFHLVEGKDHPLPGKITLGLKTAALLNRLPFLKPLGRFFYDDYVGDFMNNTIQTRRNAGEAGRRNDILQILLDTQQNEDGGLTDEEIAGESSLFLVAGAETTSNTTCFTIILLLHNPDCLRKLQQELDEEFPDPSTINHDMLKNLPYLNAVIHEGLRLRPVTMVGVRRECKEETVIRGHVFPKGTVLRACFPEAQTDSRYWGDDALEFNPDRFLPDRDYPNDAYYPFSAGTRNCIGKNFAMMEMRLAIAHIFRGFDLKIVPGQSEEVYQAITVQLKQGKFDIRVKPRKI